MPSSASEGMINNSINKYILFNEQTTACSIHTLFLDFGLNTLLCELKQLTIACLNL